ncbi:DUF58 domain-containing protein [Lentzea sp. BCCO 10_0856]|uniref:DUF58 domain-containing protein n=1 Tax=Lentzea miocenica TaxID=3095431 RepID=A0ABU4SVL7_9PSEU|nr:DUF58 domain-containing protein [Lentzea sp. BCCO 10_0856]MDX8029951.1 DUF58 domain-containing protein [Lentzea sp. BCCO 10_0856]
MGLTRGGVTVAVAGVVLLGAGLLADYPELVLIALACAAAFLVAALWMLLRPELTATRAGIWPLRVTEGEEAGVTLVVVNNGRRRSPPVSLVEKVGGHPVSIEVPSLAGRSSHRHHYDLPQLRRGVHVLETPEVGHSDPFRLMKIGSTSGTESVVRVHPRAHVVAAPPTGGPQDAEGPTSSGSPQGGVAFHSLRDYVPGDDWRLIHWRSTARTGKAVVRHHVIPDEPRQLVVLDTRRASYPSESFEDAVRVAASLVRAASRAAFPLDLRTTADVRTGDHRPAEWWSTDELPALDLLSTVEPDDGAGLRGLPGLVADVASSIEGVALTVVTGSPHAEELACLPAVRSRFLMISLVRIGERAGAEPPGAVTVDARTSTEFAALWNELVTR